MSLSNAKATQSHPGAKMLLFVMKHTLRVSFLELHSKLASVSDLVHI